MSSRTNPIPTVPHLSTAITYVPKVSAITSECFCANWEKTNLSKAEKRIAGLAIDLIVAETLRGGSEESQDKALKIALRTQIDEYGVASVTIMHWIRGKSLTEAQTKLSANFLSAHRMINHSRVATGGKPVCHMQVSAKVPELSAHERVQLEALDPDALLPPNWA